MAVNPKQVPCYIGFFLAYFDIDQIARLLMAGQIERCSDTRFEHYHFTNEALAAAASERRPLDLTSASDVALDSTREAVNALMAKIQGER